MRIVNIIRENKNKLLNVFRAGDFSLKVIVWLGILFISSIVVSIWILIIPHIKFPSSWDFLAFCGSIIGGAITWFGVKRTLNHERRLRFLDRYDVEMREITLLLDDIRFIINAKFVAEISAESLKQRHNLDDFSVKTNMLEELGTRISLFLRKVEEKYPELVGKIDWNVITKLNIYLKLMQDFKYYHKNFNNFFLKGELDEISKVFDRSIEYALSIYQLLEDHQNKMTQKYYIEKGNS